MVDNLILLTESAEQHSLLAQFAVPAIATVAGALVGSWASFFIARRRDTRQVAREVVAEWKGRAVAGRKVQFALAMQRSSLLDLKTGHMNEHRSDATNRWWKVHPILDFVEAPRLDIEALGFMLTKIESANALYTLNIAEGQYRTAMGVVAVRNRYILEFRERLAPVLRAGMPMDQAIDVIGPPLVPTLQGLTESLYDSVDKALDDNKKADCVLLETLRTEFEGRAEKWLLLGPKDDEKDDAAPER